MANVEVTITDILEYIGERSRPVKEGKAIFRAGHIILCGLEEGSSNIRSFCLQTSSLTSCPHEITISLHKDVKQWKCLCSCKAGMSGFCKHIVATLIHINRHEVLELVSCTDLEQKWGKEKKAVAKSIKAKPFREFCHPTNKKKYKYTSSSELDNRNFDLLSTGVAESALVKFISRSLTADKVVFKTSSELEKQNFEVLTAGPSLLSTWVSEPSDSEISDKHKRNIISKLFEHVNGSELINELKSELDVENFELRSCCKELVDALSSVDALEVAQFEQGTQSWAKERQLRITGSTCYSIYTFKKTEDWESKAKRTFFPKSFTNKFTEHGKKYEREAQELYSKINKCEVVSLGLIICKAFPWLGFSPDGVLFENGLPTELIEIKCPFSGKTEPANTFLESCSYLELEDRLPHLKKHTLIMGRYSWEWLF